MRKPAASFCLHPAAIARIVYAVVRTEIARLRGRRAAPMAAATWVADTPLNDEGLGIDSLEIFGILAALAELFDLDADTLTAQPPERLGDLVDWAARGAGGATARITVATSGSTGRPKRCVHALADLLDEADCLAAMVAGGAASSRWCRPIISTDWSGPLCCRPRRPCRWWNGT